MGCGGPSRAVVQTWIDAAESKRHMLWEAEVDKLAQLDALTHSRSHLLAELRSLGSVAISGKDYHGIHEKLDKWLRNKWSALPMAGTVREVAGPSGCLGSWRVNTRYVDQRRPWDRVPDASYEVGEHVFASQGMEGENNLSMRLLELVEFMVGRRGWSLEVVGGGTLPSYPSLLRSIQIRERSVVFRAPAPEALAPEPAFPPHIIVELRQVGYIDIVGRNHNSIFEKLGGWLQAEAQGVRIPTDPRFCSARFRCGWFRMHRATRENNMSQCVMKLIDFMENTSGWSLIAFTVGNYQGKTKHAEALGDREQLLVFRKEPHEQPAQQHVMIELRDVGCSEVHGLKGKEDLEPKLHEFMECSLGLSELCDDDGVTFCDRKYGATMRKTQKVLQRKLDLAIFMGLQGWRLRNCAVQSFRLPGSKARDVFDAVTEHQLFFTKEYGDPLHATKPLLCAELNAVPKVSRETGIPYVEGRLEIHGEDVNIVSTRIKDFAVCNMQGLPYGRGINLNCEVFRIKDAAIDLSYGRLLGENNIGKYTMRLCDFLGDHLDEWDLIVCSDCNYLSSFTPHRTSQLGSGAFLKKHLQLFFRHRLAREGKPGDLPIIRPASMPSADGSKDISISRQLESFPATLEPDLELSPIVSMSDVQSAVCDENDHKTEFYQEAIVSSTDVQSAVGDQNVSVAAAYQEAVVPMSDVHSAVCEKHIPETAVYEKAESGTEILKKRVSAKGKKKAKRKSSQPASDNESKSCSESDKRLSKISSGTLSTLPRRVSLSSAPSDGEVEAKTSPVIDDGAA